ncbi:MAG: lytic transglycosylase domain-containing protein [Steroidobacteraceae bacterium]|nr:lytic transglycosylase domain-containing protein [Steroidobacteraceae bacterium]
MQTAPRLITLLFFTLLALGSSARANDATTPKHVREAFVAAMAAVTAAPFVPAGGDSEALQRYPLYSYLLAARLSGQLALIRPVAAQPGGDPRLPLDDEIAAFLAQQEDRPVARKLRSAWLAHLAERQAWPTYLAQYREDRDTQSTLRCHWLAARVALGQTDGLEAELTDTWLTARSLPDACDPALAWWRARGGPGDVLVERRARLALEAGEAGLARFLAKSLPAARAAPLLQWAALIEQPGREIPALIAQPVKDVEPQALADGWSRYARADAEAAAAAFPALAQSRGLDRRAAGPYALSVALALSWSRHPRALEFFRLAHDDDFDERAHEWHARAALWAGDWREVAAATAAMPGDMRDQPRWRYWSARAREQLGEIAKARELYAAVVPTDNWYAAHAAARLDRKFTPRLEPLALNDAEVDALAAEAAFVRTRELLLCDMGAEASTEWRAAYDELPPARQVQAVGLASRWGWHDQAIATAARQKLFNDYDLLYPRPFDAEVRSASRRTGLPKELIYAIIRQESLFRADAASSAGAIGLMQLLPETARLTARRAGLPEPTRSQLTKPTVNIPLGSEFLASLVQRFEGETALAAAGYNAGPNAARRWRPAAPMDLDVWVENIPFNETRAYVQRVAWHALVFAWLADRKPREVNDWQRAVRPAASTAVAMTASQ